MSRNLKLGKLRNAVLDWRGSYVIGPGGRRTAVRPPQKSALLRLARWLKELRMDVRATVTELLACKTRRELDAWFAKQ
ncbi:MAG: hypothetical protein K9N47_21035 [Prosthecobacter sp.]|uniref:hypothetical protein n=1 Tax=Prosthecobacter sp. TaxID=1965333 RepID=UPI0026343344|nr:hypothetical protein [Prosthecobacter sp.]MCF7788621.1 hypothetical protein [Prosthecobacter sp.]